MKANHWDPSHWTGTSVRVRNGAGRDFRLDDETAELLRVCLTPVPDNMQDLIAAALPQYTPGWVFGWLLRMDASSDQLQPRLHLAKDASGRPWMAIVRGDGVLLYTARMV